jgi:hypothetical protein
MIILTLLIKILSRLNISLGVSIIIRIESIQLSHKHFNLFTQEFDRAQQQRPVSVENKVLRRQRLLLEMLDCAT